MAQQLLDRPQVRATGEQVGGEAMAERVRRRVRGQPGHLAVALHRELCDRRGQPPTLLPN